VKSAVFHKQATVEVEDAIAYLNGKRDGSGDEFRDELETAIGQIRRNPKAFSPYSGGYRKYLMGKRFPYQIFYFEYDSHVWIAAVHHASREPDTWMDRTTD
jgi:plasmid stabilization system protein ParE